MGWKEVLRSWTSLATVEAAAEAVEEEEDVVGAVAVRLAALARG